jgi:hypothetical protein
MTRDHKPDRAQFTTPGRTSRKNMTAPAADNAEAIEEDTRGTSTHASLLPV